MKIGDRVITENGAGVIKVKENDTNRFGILHDTYPKNIPTGMYTDNIMYYWRKEILRGGVR